MRIVIGPYRKNRRVSVRIHRYDTWSMDSTLAHIVVPMLKQLKAIKHGIPGDFLSKEYNRLVSSKKYHSENGKGPLGKKAERLFKEGEQRWDATLDKMIWAFEQQLLDWEDQYHSGKIDFVWKDIVGKDGKTAGMVEMKHGPKHTHKFDHKGWKKHLGRMQEGYDLFGRYYMSLWD